MAEETARLEAIVSADTRLYEQAMRALLASAQQATSRASSEFTRLDRAQQQAALGAERLAQAQTRTQQATVRLAREQANLERATAQAARAQIQLEKNQQQSVLGATTLAQAYRQVQAVLVTLGITRVVRETINLSNRFRALQIGFETITGSAQGSREELAFLREESDRLGTVFLDTARGFQGIAAAARGTILEGEGAREIFLGLTEAARATGRSQEEVNRILVAAQQIIGKGVLQQEELRQQLSEALPQAAQTFARALGVSTNQLFKMIEAGQVGLPEFLRFARLLRTDVALGIEQAGETFQAATNRMTTGVQDLGIAFGDLITKSPLVIAAIQAIGAAAQGIAKDLQAAQKVPVIAPGASLAEIERLRAQTQGLPIPLTGREGEPVPDIDELTIQRGSVAADTEAAALARIAALRKQHADAVIGSAKEQAATILRALADEEQAIKRNTIAYAEINRLRTEGPPSVRQAQELRAQLRVLEEIIPRLSQADQALAALDVQRLQGQLRDISERGLPDSVRQARELEREIARVREGLQGLSPDERALGLKELQALETRLLRLHAAVLPPTVQQVRELEAEIKRLEEAMVNLPAGDRFLAEFDLQEARDQLREFSQRGLPDAVIQTQNLRVEIERLQETINNRALELGPIGIEQAQQSLSALQDQHDELTQTLEQRIAFGALEGFGDAMAELEGDIDEGIKSAEEFITRQFEMREALARTRAESEGLFKNYVQDLRRTGVAQEDVEKKIFERFKESAREQERIRRQQAQDIRESTRELVSLVETVFDAFDLGSKKTEARIKLLLQTFSTVLQQMAQVAQQSNINVNVGATGQTGTAGTAQQVAGTAQQTGSFFGFGGGQAGGAVGQVQGGNVAGGAGTAIAGITAGIGVGQASFGFFRDKSNAFGLGAVFGERAGNIEGGVAAGALGGAIAGTAILPGIGTAIGAAIGAIAGGIIAGLQKIPKERSIEVEIARLPRAVNDSLGLSIDGVVRVIERHRNVSEPLQDTFEEGIETATQAFLNQVQSIIDIAPVDVQQASKGAVNQLLGQVSAFIEKIGIGPVKDISDEIETLVQNLTPALQAEFQDVLDSLRRIGEVTRTIDAAIDALEQRRDATLGGLREQRQRLSETFQSPGRVFIARQQELERLVSDFRDSTAAEQVALVPRIQALIDEVFTLANREDVLGGDMASLVELQANLIDINKELEEASGHAFERQIELAQQQRDSLVAMVDSLGSLRRVTEDQFREANRTLQRIADFLSTQAPGRFVGSFQTAPGEARRIPATGMAIVHEGEIIGRAQVTPRQASEESLGRLAQQGRETNDLLRQLSQQGLRPPDLPFVGSFQTAPGESRLVPATGFAIVHQAETVSRGPVGNTYNSFSITVHAPPNTNAQQLSQELLSQIELQMNRRARFRQNPVSQRGN